MQLMTWMLARLGSRFTLLFEPHHRRVKHSALGRPVAQPLELMVGLVEPDGTQRVLPFASQGTLFENPEQFERLNSITFRGFSPHYRLRFELNIHSVFYPQDERLCLMPAFYLEMRISPAKRFRGITPRHPMPEKVKLFIRLGRADTQITAAVPDAPSSRLGGWIDMAYRSPLEPAFKDYGHPPRAGETPDAITDAAVEVRERIVSLNKGCMVDGEGKGLTLDLPVTEVGRGTKWRLVWGAYSPQAAVRVGHDPDKGPAPLRYLRHWPNLDAVMDEAVTRRDDRLAHSRRLEKLIDQAPLETAQRHLLNQGFQVLLGNTRWCDLDDGSQWFAAGQEGRRHDRSPIELGYYTSPFYLALWPRLLAMQLQQWVQMLQPHEQSGGAHFVHGTNELTKGSARQALSRHWVISDTCSYLLLLQAYAHWTGDQSVLRNHAQGIEQVAKFVLWADQDNSGFPLSDSEGIDAGANASDSMPHRQTHLAIKRIAALQAAYDLLTRNDQPELARRCHQAVETDAAKIESRAWVGDHYAAYVDPSPTDQPDAWIATPEATVSIPTQASGYAIHTGGGLLLPIMMAQPALLDLQRLAEDVNSAARETLVAYGSGLTSEDIEDVWISRNVWRDCLAIYLDCGHASHAQRYWDLQVACNTHTQSMGYCDTYIGHEQSFSARGAASFGVLLACPRLVIDRLAPGGVRISVEPHRHFPQRWPLLPLADWKAGRVPVCVVNPDGHVTIESESDPVIIHGQQASPGQMIG